MCFCECTQVPSHLESTFMKQKQQKIFNLSKFVKRFFVFDLHDMGLPVDQQPEGVLAHTMTVMASSDGFGVDWEGALAV